MSERKFDFQEIHDAFRPKILRYLSRFVDTHEAEELTQEVFLKVSRALSTYRGESQLSTWIYRIATNAALDSLRSSYESRVRQMSVMSQPTDVKEEDNGIWDEDTTDSAEQQIARQEMNECIRDSVDNLPDEYRLVLVLSELEGFKDKEIATILGTSLGAVKIRLHRARTRLKKKLLTHCSFYQDDRGELACDIRNAYGRD